MEAFSYSVDAVTRTVHGGKIMSRLIREEDLLYCLGFENTEKDKESEE